MRPVSHRAHLESDPCLTRQEPLVCCDLALCNHPVDTCTAGGAPQRTLYSQNQVPAVAGSADQLHSNGSHHNHNHRIGPSSIPTPADSNTSPTDSSRDASILCADAPSPSSQPSQTSVQTLSTSLVQPRHLRKLPVSTFPETDESK